MKRIINKKIAYGLYSLALMFFTSACTGIDIRIFSDVVKDEGAAVAVLRYEATTCIPLVSCSYHFAILGSGSWEMDKKIITVKPERVTKKYITFSDVMPKLATPGNYVLQNIEVKYSGYSYSTDAVDKKNYKADREDTLRAEARLKATYSRNRYSFIGYGDREKGDDASLGNAPYKKVPLRIQYDTSLYGLRGGGTLPVPFSRIGIIDMYFTDEPSFYRDPKEACELMPDDPEACLVSGRAYAKSGNHQQAIEMFSRSIKLAPNEAKTYFARGNSFALLKLYDNAADDYTKVIALRPDFPEAYFSRGYVSDESGKHAQAIADYTNTIQLQPGHAEAYYNRGNSYSKVGDDQKAIENYTLAIQYKPDHAGAYFNRGNAHTKAHDYQAAIADYSSAIRYRPADAGAYLNRGRVYAAVGNNELAKKDYQKALELNPALKSMLETDPGNQ